MEEKSIALSILGIVAVLAIIGLILLFKASGTGDASYYLQGGQFSEFGRSGYSSYGVNDQYQNQQTSALDQRNRGDGSYAPLYYIQGQGTPIGTYAHV